MFHPLQWPSLQLRRYTSRLTQIHIIPPISTTSYQQSFFPKTIKQWNSLTNDQININSLELFIASLKSHNIVTNYVAN